ncbi:MAG: AroM family protein [Limnochordales bacterium]|nr:AroM family protein [Limnochordales bacterium]
MPQTRLGLVTIGQSPREDLAAHLRPYLTGDIELVQAGALDGLAPDELAQLSPAPEEATYITKLRDGTSVTVATARLMPYVRGAVRRLEARDVSAILLLCTGRFPPLGRSRLVVEPERVIGRLVDALRPRRLGVLVPLGRQAEQMGRKWQKGARQVFVESASPYDDDLVAFDAAVEGLARRQPDLVVLDCMGYAQRHWRRAQELLPCPVLLSISTVGAVVGQLVGAPVGAPGRSG